MSYSIYDQFLTHSNARYYCEQIAKELNLDIYDYFYDNYTEQKFPGESDIYKFKAFQCYDTYRIKFNLCKPKTIMKTGLNAWVLKTMELRFHLTIKGFSFVYVVKFSSKKAAHTVPNDIPGDLYVQEESGQMCMILN